MHIVAALLFFFLICIIVMLIIGSYEEKRLRIREYRIDNEFKKSKAGIRLALISDLHNNHYGNNYSRIFEIIEKYNPDAIIVAGDIVVCRDYMRAQNIESARFLVELSKKKKIYYGMGNHEQGIKLGLHDTKDFWMEYCEILSDGNIVILDNASVKIEKGNMVYQIYGLNIASKYYKRLSKNAPDSEYISSLIGNRNDGCYNILIAHNPDYFDAYERWGADLVLSGHNHGGLVRLPLLGGVLSPKLHIFPKYDYGKYNKNKTTMLVSNGMGSHSLKIRFNNIPELQIIDIN